MVRSKLICLMLVLLLSILLLFTLNIPASAGTTGIISGIITDADTGDRLAGANVIVEGTGLTTVTDRNGYYVITNVSPGTYKVTASLIGYADVMVSNVSVVMDVTSKVDVQLAMSVTEEEQVVIVGVRSMINPDVTPTMYIIEESNEEAVKGQPNLLYQAPGLVKTQPGVIPDESGVPHIRGGRADQIGWTIDGIPVFDPVSNGFGTNLVTVGMDKMEVYTGGYRAEYGNAISGVLNEVVKTGRNAPGGTLQFMGGSQDFRGLYPEIGGYNEEEGFDYYAGAYIWQSELQDAVFDEVDSIDTIGKFNFPVGNKGKLTLLMAQGAEDYYLPSSHTETVEDGMLVSVDPARDVQNQSHLLGALTYTHTFDTRSFLEVRPYFFRSRQSLDGIGMDDGYGWFTDSESETTGLITDYTSHLSPKHLLKVGGFYMSSNNRYYAIVPYLNDLYYYYFDMDLEDYEYNANADTLRTGFYVQDQMTVGSKMIVDAGIRYDRITYDKVENPDQTESQYSPRFGVAYSLDSNNKLKSSWGKYIQFPRTQAVERVYTDSGWLDARGFGNAVIEPERCTQFDFGWERQFSKDCSFQITPFYREYDNLLQTQLVDPGNPYGPSIYVNVGEGTSKGVELLIQKRQNDNWSGWLSYTYMEAKAQSSDSNLAVESDATYWVDWDQRHSAAMVVNYMNGPWTFSLVGEYGSGLPYGDGNTLRVPSHLVFDLNISCDVKDSLLPDGRLTLGIANLFNTRKTLDGELVPDYDENYEIIGSHFEATSSVAPRFINLSYSKQY